MIVIPVIRMGRLREEGSNGAQAHWRAVLELGPGLEAPILTLPFSRGDHKVRAVPSDGSEGCNFSAVKIGQIIPV